jgi:hypothetical protein
VKEAIINVHTARSAVVGENTNNGTKNQFVMKQSNTVVVVSPITELKSICSETSDTVVGVFTNNCGEGICEL